MNRTLLISILIVLILGAGIGGYFIFFGSTPSVSVAPTPTSSNLPVAGQTTSNTNTSATPVNTPVGTPVAVSGRLVQITTGPVVPGEIILDTKAVNASSSPTVTVQYIARESGNVFSYSPTTKTLTRINNKTIPGIQSASWLPDGSTAFVRYLSGTDFSTINTYGLLATSSRGFFLPQNISDISVSSASVLTLASGINGSEGSLARTDGTRSTPLFTTPLTALRVSFAGKNQYLAFSKPSGTLAGNAFLVSATGRFSRIAGPHTGLVALASPEGKWVLVSYTNNSALQMELINTATGAALPLPIASIADKCVWTADESAIYCGVPVNPNTGATYPDDWYQGAVHFSDRIWKIDVAGRYAQLVLDFSATAKGDLDATALAINQSRTTLVFVNKNDDSLWSYSL